MNLNKTLIPTDRNPEPLADCGVRCEHVEAHFRNLEDKLVGEIRKADYVVGCVAWLTNEKILNALALIQGAALVVQKEDFLRPDIKTFTVPEFTKKLRRQYARIKNPLCRFSFPGLMGKLSYCNDPTFDAIRCVGNHNKDKSPAAPRMHNKFVVFCRVIPTLPEPEGGSRGSPEWDAYYKSLDNQLEPIAVWTGSFNFTLNANNSLENAVIIRHPDFAWAYYNEWAQIMALSEPLDWDEPWVAPQWRIGS